MNWSSQQSAALVAVNDWYKSKLRKQVFKVFGYAGVGKTSLAKHFAESIKGQVLFAAYTGKAALMMRNNGCTGASTIHSLIYKPEEDDNGNVTFVLNHSSPLKMASMLVIDECSMVDESLAADILSFKVPVLVIGDPAQLPPVNGAGYFTNGDPDVMLTEIHRQAKDNPIIYLATQVREGQRIYPGVYGDSIIKDEVTSLEELVEYDQVIVGRNATRKMLNDKIRELRGYEGTFPVDGERLICLRNDKLVGILNGEMFHVTARMKLKAVSDYTRYDLMDADTGEKLVRVRVHDCCFDGSPKPDIRALKGTQEFDYGYAITAHKSQGSQWNSVVIFDESWCFREDASRWLYTAITRAQSKILLYHS
jgi:exodeoxyribonuclease-5